MSNKPLILVVDDDVPILVLMKNLLREFGFETATAASGQQAIEEARKQPPSLILLDKNMPGMSGDEVLQTLREEGSIDGIPVLILSGEPVEPNELQRLGATAAILKPFDVTKLIETIRTHVAV
jgi:two-component system, repressor protein LuxO